MTNKPKFYMVRTEWGIIRSFLFNFDGIRLDFTQNKIEAARCADRQAVERVATMCGGKVVEWKLPKGSGPVGPYPDGTLGSEW